MKISTLVAAAAAVTFVAGSYGGTLTALPTFGGGDGWRAPNEIVTGDTAGTATGSNYNYLQTAGLERGLAYNPTTGNLVLVSRSGAGNGIRLLSGSTGADVGALNQGTGIITGGTFATNMVGVADDGVTYVGNLSTSATAAFKVYRWSDSNSTTTPTVAYNAAIASTIDRAGDSFAVYGSGTGTKLAAAGSATTNRSSFAAFSTTDGLSFSSTAYANVPGTLTTSNDYRLALTFIDSDTLIGNQGTNARITDFGTSATVTATIALGAAQRPMDYVEINSFKLLAVGDTNSSLVSVYEISNPALPILLATGNNTSGTLTANANGTGGVAFGAINASNNSATLYAMSSNQGIQAFTFVVPEPTSITALAGLGMLVVRRRK